MEVNVLIIGSIILTFWLFVLTLIVVNLRQHYSRLTRGVTEKDLISSLNHLVAKAQANQEDIEIVKKLLEKLSDKTKAHFQKLGFKRFNPFTDTGGNQSFILSLLDENGNGFVVSSLHSRETTRLYAKKIEQGKCPDQVLSKEEQSVITEALH